MSRPDVGHPEIEQAPHSSLLQRAAEAFQLDRALLYALASRVWQAVSGPITIALVLGWLTPDEQGIYYTLVTVVGIQAFFELGLLNVLISQAGHAQAAIDRSADKDAASRMGWVKLRDLVVASKQWFAAAAIGFTCTALVFGWITYSRSDAPDLWQAPLLLIVPLAGVSVFYSPMLALLEGIGQRQYVYRLRLLQMVFGSLAVWFCLATGWGLWALVLATLVQTLFFVVGSRRLEGLIRQSMPAITTEQADDSEHFRWMRDVMPSQWRLAAISAAYHFATQLFPLIVLTYHGTVEAGRLGMTLTVTTAIQMLSLSWIQTKYSVAARTHGAGERELAGTMWRRTTLISAGIMLLGFGTLALLIPAVGWIRADLPVRFIAPVNVLWLGLGALANLGVSAQSFYALSRGRPPFLVPSLIGCGTVAGCVWGFGAFFGVSGIAIAYALATLLVFLPLHSYAYLQYRTDNT